MIGQKTSYRNVAKPHMSPSNDNDKENVLIHGPVQGVVDACEAGDRDAASIGKRIVLPSSFIGGPRHMQQLFQDAMAIVRKLGKPDYFITFTCNAEWPEITAELLPGQTAWDRPDLVARVFKLKLKALLSDLLKQQVLGRVLGHIRVVEFQKRGLPHAHILLIMAPKDVPRCTTDYDLAVCAEIPDPVTHPKLHETITRCMMHGPCGEHCS